MILTGFNIAVYLANTHSLVLENKLIEYDDLLYGNFNAIEDQEPLETNRNNVFIVNKNKLNRSLFVKQSKTFEASRIDSLQTEAVFYENVIPTILNTFKYKFPRFYHYNVVENILVLEYINNSHRPTTLFRNAKLLPKIFLEKVADLLATFHNSLTIENIKKKKLDKFFDFRKPLFFTYSLKQIIRFTNSENIRIRELGYELNNDKVKDIMYYLIRDWKQTHLIHGDIKFGNFLVLPIENQNDLMLIDFELAIFGDPLWDAAGIVQHLLKDLKSYSETNLRPNEIYDCIKLFILKYLEVLQPNSKSDFTSILKIIKFAALKEIQNYYINILRGTSQSLNIQRDKAFYAIEILKDPKSFCNDKLDLNIDSNEKPELRR